ncbi:hypothetical protein BGZ83_002399 [Gryganskiella cystojenkinii]|nr:hypothetical protein BGZ83_002399 [Gryganskiella cystojenkinii]
MKSIFYTPHVGLPAVLAGAVFNEVIAFTIFTVFSDAWITALKTDHGAGEHWKAKDGKSADFYRLIAMDFGMNVGRAWITGLLLNLTQAKTLHQAFQLGTFLYLGTLCPQIASELLWEKRNVNLQQFKFLTGFFNTVIVTCMMHAIGTY